jgi:SAM-dependent methyltransferase
MPPNAAESAAAAADSAYRAGLLAQYALVAARYEAEVIPAFGPLADAFSQWVSAVTAAQQAGQLYDPFDELDPAPRDLILPRALDLGTGTGIFASLLRAHVTAVEGLDLSAPMLRSAPRHESVHYTVGDNHHLPYKRGAFPLVGSAFGLNNTAPKPVFRECLRVLRPDGLLLYQEWGARDALSAIIDHALDAFAPTDPDAFDLDDALLEFLDADKPWYQQLQDADDHQALLKRVGFSLAWAQEAAFVTVPIEIAIFIRYKLAFPGRRATVDAMSPAMRERFMTTLNEQLAPYADANGLLQWSPPLIRVCAVK